MNLLPFGKLAPHRPRTFVPQDINLGDWPQIAPLFDQLEVRAAQAKFAAELERWLIDWSELNAALDEEASRRYIAMTCHTDNADAEKAYLHFVEHVEPQLKPRQFALENIYVAHPSRADLLSGTGVPPVSFNSNQAAASTNPRAGRPCHYAVFDRDLKNHVELFRPENVALETEEAKLAQQYQKLIGAQTVTFRGEEKTLVQMGRYLEEPDRALRQEAWELVAKRRLQDVDKCEEIFDQLIQLRTQIAKNAGFENYRDYAFRQKGRFDYTPENCFQFHDAVEKEIMPAVREIQNDRKRQLKLENLRPWDLAVDPQNRAPLKPFMEVGEMVSRTQKIFNHLDPELAAGFQQMQDLKLLDLDNRKGKAPGGYQSTLSEARVPFIFMNAIGLQRDVETILHEAGHAFHAQATRDEDLYAYRGAPIEFCEVASMAMELLGNEFLEEFYPANSPLTPALSPKGGEGEKKSAPSADANRARKTHLEGIIGFFPWMATVDAFQHWIYTHAGHTRAERKAAYLQLMDRFGGDVDYFNYEEVRAHSWHRQLHIFIHPFYYVEYGIAQLGALQVWANSKANKAKALGDYKKSLALGGSRPLPELFAAAGCKFQFDAATIKPLIQLAGSELAKL
ncbi:MAG TPA: M3 family oligoendopeptidase [Verrucomicrobiae bacterium]|nr:M3 family oligoendopeptidase [Verrucomicrobiae bacterium]